MKDDNKNQLPPYTLSLLRDLVYINIDSCQGYLTAKRLMKNKTIAALFDEFADQRAKFAADLKDSFEQNNPQNNNDNPRCKADQWWLAMQINPSPDDEYNVLTKVELAESNIKTLYEQALKETDGRPIHNLLKSQFHEIQFSHHFMRDLQELTRDN